MSVSRWFIWLMDTSVIRLDFHMDTSCEYLLLRLRVFIAQKNNVHKKQILANSLKNFPSRHWQEKGAGKFIRTREPQAVGVDNFGRLGPPEKSQPPLGTGWEMTTSYKRRYGQNRWRRYVKIDHLLILQKQKNNEITFHRPPPTHHPPLPTTTHSYPPPITTSPVPTTHNHHPPPLRKGTWQGFTGTEGGVRVCSGIPPFLELCRGNNEKGVIAE